MYAHSARLCRPSKGCSPLEHWISAYPRLLDHTALIDSQEIGIHTGPNGSLSVCHARDPRWRKRCHTNSVWPAKSSQRDELLNTTLYCERTAGERTVRESNGSLCYVDVSIDEPIFTIGHARGDHGISDERYIVDSARRYGQPERRRTEMDAIRDYLDGHTVVR